MNARPSRVTAWTEVKFAPSGRRPARPARSLPQPEVVVVEIDRERLGTAPLPLTDREYQVAQLLADGLSSPVIATSLFVSYETVRTYVARIFTALEIQPRRRNVLIVYLRARGYGSPLPPLPFLTPREMTVVKGLRRGLTGNEMAAELGLSPLTIKAHIARISTRAESKGMPVGVLVARSTIGVEYSRR